jgi:hypothetical protein
MFAFFLLLVIVAIALGIGIVVFLGVLLLSALWMRRRSGRRSAW